MCYTLESCAPFSVKICEQTPHFLAMHLKHVSQSWLRFMCRLLHRNKEKSNHFPCSSKTACKTRPPILFLKSTMGPCIQSKERERSAPLEAWMFRGLLPHSCPACSCAIMGHAYPRCYCLSQRIVSGHTDMQFTWQCVIMTFSLKPGLSFSHTWRQCGLWWSPWQCRYHMT